MTLSTTIRQALVTARKSHRPRVTQEDLAVVLKVGKSTVGTWERGIASPTWEQLDRWADAVGLCPPFTIHAG